MDVIKGQRGPNESRNHLKGMKLMTVDADMNGVNNKPRVLIVIPSAEMRAVMASLLVERADLSRTVVIVSSVDDEAFKQHAEDAAAVVLGERRKDMLAEIRLSLSDFPSLVDCKMEEWQPRERLEANWPADIEDSQRKRARMSHRLLNKQSRPIARLRKKACHRAC